MTAAIASCPPTRAARLLAVLLTVAAAVTWGWSTSWAQAPSSVYSRGHSQPPAPRPVQQQPGSDASQAAAIPQNAADGQAGQAEAAAQGEPATAADRAAQAERIVTSSLAGFSRAESVAVKLRQRVRIGDRVLVGTGRYLQVGHGDDLRFRFETTLTGDTETFEIAEICDGLFCWLHRRAGPDPATLHRIDVQRVRSRLGELHAPDTADTAMYLGGLQRVLWSARQWFNFEEAVPGDLDGRPVWIVEGRWNPIPLAALQPARAEAARQPGGIRPEQLPDGMPWAIRFAIGRGDLVPYRLEYLAIPGPRPVAARPVEPIGVIDLVEVEFDGAVDPTAFYFQPATEGLIDITEPYVGMLGLMRP